MLTREKIRRRAMPNAWPEVPMTEATPAWFQVQGDGEWSPGKGRVAALHQDGLGLRLLTDASLPRGTSLMVNMTLPSIGSLHVRATVSGCRKDGRAGYAAVLRFEHLAEVDRLALQAWLKDVPEEQPAPPDNRKYRRYVRSVPVDYQVHGQGGLEPGKGQMVTLDIGGGGIKFRVSHALTVGDMLYVRLPLGRDPFFSLGKVIWTETSRVPGRTLAGLQFVDLPPVERDRLMHHLSLDT